MEYLISRINWRMMKLFAAEDPAQIAHTQSVHDYTRVRFCTTSAVPHPGRSTVTANRRTRSRRARASWLSGCGNAPN